MSWSPPSNVNRSGMHPWMPPSLHGYEGLTITYGRAVAYDPSSNINVLMYDGSHAITAIMLAPITLGKTYKVNYMNGVYTVGDQVNLQFP